MTLGVGGSTIEAELSKLTDMTEGVKPISEKEHESRIARAQSLMREQGIDAIYVNAGTNLYYFTGTSWYPSERMVGAIIPAHGKLEYIAPSFEKGTFNTLMKINANLNVWEEHENPYKLFAGVLAKMGLENATLGFDESASFFIYDGINKACDSLTIVNAVSITSGCRMQKSENEIAIMQRANDMTMVVHKAVARILRPGITVKEVTDFIHEAHKRVGSSSGSAFCIVLFGVDSSFPHGVKKPKSLEENDAVLIDTGCELYNYFSDITRSYVFGKPSKRYREIWNHEKEAQAHAFSAASIGVSCAEVDTAARSHLELLGYGPDYALPGLPHRTGHGIGLDIHENPYLVRSDLTRLAKGMCCSNEPMLCIPDEFGIRHEDHFYMTDSGPKWFTEPAYSVDDPFGYEA